MSMHERSLPWLVCFQFLLPWCSTLLDPSAFLMTKTVNLGAWDESTSSSARATEAHTLRDGRKHTSLQVRRPGSKPRKALLSICLLPQALRVERKGCTNWRTSGPQSRTKGLYQLKNLWSTPAYAWGAARCTNSRGEPIFPFSPPRPNANTSLWMVGWKQEVWQIS